MKTTGCSNHYCYLTGRKRGLGTNSMCTCLQYLPFNDRVAIERRIQILEGAIKGALQLEQLWMPIQEKFSIEHEDEYKALAAMKERLESAL